MSGAGRMLSFIAAGDPNRPLVVLLHGVCDAAIAWSDYIDYLSHDFRVVAVDMLACRRDMPMLNSDIHLNPRMRRLRRPLNILNTSTVAGRS